MVDFQSSNVDGHVDNDILIVMFYLCFSLHNLFINLIDILSAVISFENP